MTGSEGNQRRQQLSDGLTQVRARIADACALAGREPASVTLVVVTKTYPATDVQHLAALGVRDVGENRPQEAAHKRAELAALDEVSGIAPVSVGPLRWHLVGALQTNKARSVAAWADVVHSLDRERAVSALARAAAQAGRVIQGLVQVSLDGDPGRGGAPVDQVPALADLVAASPGLELQGVMAVAPLAMDPARAFDLLAQVAADVRGRHPKAVWISAGMSADLEPAIQAGATHVRVGSAVLGERPRLR